MAEQNNKGKDQDLNKLQMVRREKLADLQAAGKDPFVITKYDVQQHSADVKEMYTAHEAELLAGRQTPSVEDLEEAEKREVLNNDYNERRAIMDASPINVSIAGRMMFKEIRSVRSHTLTSRSQISVIYMELRDMHSEQRLVRYPYMQRRSHFSLSHSRSFLRSSTD